MTKRKKISSLIIFLIILITGVFWFKPATEWKEGMIIATAVPATTDLIDQDLGTDGRYIKEARIIGIDPNKNDSEPLLFTEEFYSARSPEVSYDGTKLLFTAQKNEEDPWQIYIRNMITFDLVQVTSGSVNCTDPAWLPDGRVLYSMLNSEFPGGEMHALYISQPDGCCSQRLTYHPESAISSSVTNDGRIVTLSRQIYPEPGKNQFMALRTDGTKSELFYKAYSNGYPQSRCWETMDGGVYFIEKISGENTQNILVRVAFGHPLSSRKPVSGSGQMEMHSLFPLDADNLLISGRPGTDQPYGLYLFNLSERKTGKNIWSSNDYHLIEPVLVKNRPIPKQLPETVDNSGNKGTLLCHDAGHSQTKINDDIANTITDRVQVLGLEGMLGEVKVEKDGSFYLQVDADKPVRFQTVNAQGEILRGPSSWIWVRPNEKRSCIGCHEDRELAPGNRVPEALYSGMVTLPEGTRTESVVLSKKGKK